MQAAPRQLNLGLVLTVIVLAFAEFVTFKFSATLFARFHTGWTFYLPADLECIVAHSALTLGLTHTLPAGMESFLYPPPILLLGAPLNFISANIAYSLWSALGIALFCLAGWRLKLHPLLILGAVLLPPSIYCLLLGQTGLILSALFILALHWARRRPVLSGIITGFMILKPPAALLLPICYAAAGKRSAIIAATISVLSICALTLLVFGVTPWVYFFKMSLPEGRHILQAPWHHDYQNIMVSPFILLRSLGGGLQWAYVIQGAITLLACGLTWRLWRTPQEPGDDVMLITACLTALASPYNYFYDLPAIGLLLLATWPGRGWKLAAALCFMLGVACYVFISVKFLPIGALLTAGVCLAFWPGRRALIR